MVWMPMAFSFPAVALPTENNSPTGNGQNFSGISSGKRVCTRSGFSKSLAILAKSLLRLTPMFTVKPSSVRMASRIA